MGAWIIHPESGMIAVLKVLGVVQTRNGTQPTASERIHAHSITREDPY